MSGDAVGITLGHLISIPCHEESMETEFIPFESVPSEMACICFEFVDSLIDERNVFFILKRKVSIFFSREKGEAEETI